MDFFKKMVPSVMSGDVVLDVGSTICESSPKLLKMTRTNLLSLGQTIEGDIHLLHPNYSMYLCKFLKFKASVIY